MKFVSLIFNNYGMTCIITATESILPQKRSSDAREGLPGYTFQKAPGELWRSMYDKEKHIIVINNHL